MELVMIDKLTIIIKWKEFINRYEDLIYNVPNKYKVIKNKIFDNMYDILENIYYCNLLEKNKRINYQRKIICSIKILDYYFNKLLLYRAITLINYNKLSKDLEIMLKLLYAWSK